MSAAAELVRCTYAEYLALERRTDQRHEYFDGEVFLIAGGTLRHVRLKTNVPGLMFARLGDGPCQAYDADAKIRVPATGLATYPDLSVICGQPERHPEDPNAATNPTLIVEVLSESTEVWDRTRKFFHYQQLPSLRHYLLVSHDDVRVEHFERAEAGAWTYRVFGSGDVVALSLLGVSLPVDALYKNLPDDPA